MVLWTVHALPGSSLPSFFQPLELAESFYPSHFIQEVQSQEGTCQGEHPCPQQRGWGPQSGI